MIYFVSNAGELSREGASRIRLASVLTLALSS